MTSNSKAEGRFGKQDFRYVAEENVYICRAGERRAYHFTNEENGLVLHRYWTNACQSNAIKQRSDEPPDGRETVEHPFGTIKARMGATHFVMKTLPRVAAEMAPHVLAHNLTRVMNIMGGQPLMVAMRA